MKPASIQLPISAPRASLMRDPRLRGLFYQAVLLAIVIGVGVEFALNAKANLEAQRIATGFGFLDNTAGFGVNQALIPYQESDSYGRVWGTENLFVNDGSLLPDAPGVNPQSAIMAIAARNAGKFLAD